MDFNRSAGVSIWVSRLENMPDTWLRPGRSDLSCTETGTIATSVESGSSPRSSRNLRSTPETSAITTSLTLTPKWFFTVLMCSRSSCAYAMLRWLVTLALNAVLGAANGRAIASPLRARLTVSTTVETVVGTTLINFSGREANFIAPLIAISSSLPPPTPSTGSGAGASGSVPHSCDIRLAPVTPSTPAWCTFVMTASRPPASACASVPAMFSMTHISHSGRLRSSGSDAIWPQISASSWRPPGAGKADAVQMPVDVEVVVVNPHRMVGVEPAVGELLAELRHRLDA